MAFDSSTRNRLAKFVADARRVLTEEFAEQLQSLYGISVTGGIAPLARLAHLDAEGMELAATLRQRVAYLETSIPDSGDATKAAIDRLTREQAFTVLNRLAAIRMAEKRGLIVESVGQQYQSKGFKVFESVAGSAIGDTYDRYRCYLFCLFDELAIDLGSLFDRRSPQALLFPRETSLLALLDLLDASDLQDLWAEDETIGWIYQYYNDPAERKKMRDESAAPRNSRELAVRNQFFTPRYVVEFLTDNTLGRIWYEMTQGVTVLKEQCRYLVRRPTEVFLQAGESAPEQPAQDGLSQEELLKQPVFIAHRPLKDPRNILMLDPACGSMHFGLYAFDLFEAIYEEAWEIATGSDAGAKSGEAFAPFCAFAASCADKAAFQRDVPRMIVEHNLHGIDIDPRAAQIAGLSLWLRAQRAWHAAGIKPVDRPRITRSNIVCAEPMPGDKVLLAEFVEQQFPEGERAAFGFLLEKVFDRMTLAGEAGSLLKIEEEIRTAIAEAKKLWEKEPTVTQRMLFTGGDDKPTATQKKLDLSGITDEEFWEGAEERIYDALRDYAEQAESGGFQRRLFAEDAARGFAFIDVCRKRYDVALMNPPFGEACENTRALIARSYPTARHDILACFLEQCLERCVGLGGAITSRAVFFLSTFENWRLATLHRRLAFSCFADLGQGVLDGAMVEVGSYCFEKSGRTCTSPFFRLQKDMEKADRLRESIADLNSKIFPRDTFLQRSSFFDAFPGKPLSYWASAEQRTAFASLPPFEASGRTIRQGLGSADDFRFVRCAWEVDAVSINHTLWVRYAKGGSYSPYFADVPLLLNWNKSAAEIWTNLTPRGSIRSNIWMLGETIDRFFFKPGISFPSRPHRKGSFAVLPSGCAISVSGMAVFEPTKTILVSTALLNSTPYLGLLELLMPRGSEGGQTLKFEKGYLTSVPIPSLNSTDTVALESAAKRLCERRLIQERGSECCSYFALPEEAGSRMSFAHAARWMDARRAEDEQIVCKLSDEVDVIAERAYGILSPPVPNPQEATHKLDGDPEDAEAISQGGSVDSVVSYLLGSAYGRWDIRYATGEQTMPELPDPFAPLPACPPGQLQNAQGLPAGPEDVPATYPIKDIPWDGILVDDPSHPLDIERRVREVIEIIWTGKEGGPTAEAIELEACEILGVKTLRDYFRKPANFFADHLKRYSKSRRQAPIYWPLSTKSGSYTLWIYYHRLNDQTLHKCLADFVDPKIKEVENELGKLTGKDSGRAADLSDFLNELKDLKDEIERVIKLPWKPNLNDGVLITASPLWKLFRLSRWQRDLKACWEELEKGDYDWAHLAYTIWPERVEKVCEKDRSIAIAHGLEHLCKIEPPKPKKPRGKKASS